MTTTPQTPASGEGRHILVVEDDAMIAQAVAARLRSAGHRVTVCGDGIEALAAASADVPDLVVLDLMLPGLDGLEVCRRLQADRPTPVVMLTAKDEEVDELIGLGVGADDYLTKPFSPRVLLARVQALLRRVDRDATALPEILRAGPVTLDVSRRTVTAPDGPVHLTAIEFDLLAELARRPGHVRSRAALVSAVWGYSDEAAERTVDSHVRSIRQKLGEAVVRTVRGVGYATADPSRPSPETASPGTASPGTASPGTAHPRTDGSSP